jgi:hypothetical protein
VLVGLHRQPPSWRRTRKEDTNFFTMFIDCMEGQSPMLLRLCELGRPLCETGSCVRAFTVVFLPIRLTSVARMIAALDRALR